MRALVTGCAGFIGSHLVDYLLKNDHEVYGIDSFTNYYSRGIKESNIRCALDHTQFHLLERDINEMNDFPDVDHVFHVAAQAGVRTSWGTTFGIYVRNNIDATQRLLEYYKDKKLSSFVNSSSSSVYGDSPLPMSESNQLKPVSPYGVTKLAAENLCYLYWKNYGLPAISLRYFTVFGPRGRPDMAMYKFARSIINGEEIVLYGDGTQTRDFTYVDDIINANIMAARSREYGQVFNIGGGNRITVNDLIAIMGDKLHKKPVIKKIEKQKGDVDDTWADISKAKKVLGWKPETGISPGVEKFIHWYVNCRNH